jgi:thioredoxin reductase (NADPH)
VIAASGARYRRLEVENLGRFEGVSIHYAATQAEAQRCEGEEVAVVGGGNSAGQAALFLAGRTRTVYFLKRGGDLGKSMSRYLLDRITAAGNIELLANAEVGEIVGEDRLDGLVVRDNRSGASNFRGLSAVRLYRCRGQHWLARRERRTRRTRLRPDGKHVGPLPARELEAEPQS